MKLRKGYHAGIEDARIAGIDVSPGATVIKAVGEWSAGDLILAGAQSLLREIDGSN
jgi:electron transfer flavoprotein alpha/beta subunit